MHGAEDVVQRVVSILRAGKRQGKRYDDRIGWLDPTVNAEGRVDLQVIGEGSYGMCFDSPIPGTVLKISEEPNNDGWVEFISFAIKNPHKNLPKVYAALFAEDIVVVCMKRYRPVDFPYGGVKHKLALEGNRLLPEAANDEFNEMDKASYQPHNRGNTDAARIIAEFALSTKQGLCTDFRASNVMYDDDLDCLVVTDPYSSMPTWPLVRQRLVGIKHVRVEYNARPEKLQTSKSGGQDACTVLR